MEAVCNHPSHHRRISARGVVAGVLVALACQALLTVLGAAIGLTAFEPDKGILRDIGIGAGVWMLLSLCISAFVGGLVASTSAETPFRRDGLLHGAVNWAALTVIGVFFVSGALGAIGSGALDILGSAPRIQQGELQRRANEALGRVNPNDPATQERADQAATRGAIGLWGLFLTMALPLCSSLLGGWAGARSESRLHLRYTEPVTTPPPVYRPPVPTT